MLPINHHVHEHECCMFVKFTALETRRNLEEVLPHSCLLDHRRRGSIWLLFCFDHCSGPTSECQMRRTPDFLSVWFEFAGFGPSQVTGLAFSNTGDCRADCSNKKWPCTILIKTLRYCFHIEAKANTFHLTSWEI